MTAAIALAAVSLWMAPDGARVPWQSPGAPQEVIADIQVRGNVVTTDEEMRQLAGIAVGDPVGSSTADQVADRLRRSRRFERVDVLKRFASIADPTQVVLVIVVDEGPVGIERTGDERRATRAIRTHGAPLFLPVLHYDDGYGFVYGVRLAAPVGTHTRFTFPLTWGGEKRAAAQLERDFEGRRTSVSGGVSIDRRTHPYFDEDDDRRRVWAHADRQVAASLRAGATAGWQHVSFLGSEDDFAHVGVDATYDNRLDPITARNALYGRASWERIVFGTHDSVSRWSLEGHAYVGLLGQSVLVLRARRDDASGPLPAYLQSILGGVPTVRGFPLGTAIGDRLVAGSTELRVPLNSPLKMARIGVSAFFDAGTSYGFDQRLGDQPVKKGAGGSVWMSVAFLRFDLAVAHGIGASTRVHFQGAASF